MGFQAKSKIESLSASDEFTVACAKAGIETLKELVQYTDEQLQSKGFTSLNIVEAHALKVLVDKPQYKSTTRIAKISEATKALKKLCTGAYITTIGEMADYTDEELIGRGFTKELLEEYREIQSYVEA